MASSFHTAFVLGDRGGDFPVLASDRETSINEVLCSVLLGTHRHALKSGQNIGEGPWQRGLAGRADGGLGKANGEVSPFFSKHRLVLSHSSCRRRS